jgi:cytochrome o ubiquinol oxidase subunit 2
MKSHFQSSETAWFRASNARATYRPELVYSGRIELIVWSIPLLVIMLLGGVIWIGAYDLDPAQPLASDTAPLEIQARRQPGP